MSAPSVAARLKALEEEMLDGSCDIWATELAAIRQDVERLTGEARHWHKVGSEAGLRDPWALAIERLGDIADALGGKEG